MTGSFLEEPRVSPQVQALYDDDLADGGYVWNMSRLWAHQQGPERDDARRHRGAPRFRAR